MNLRMYRTWLSEQSTRRVASEVATVRENLNKSQSARAREAWQKMLNTAQEVLQVKEAKDEVRTYQSHHF